MKKKIIIILLASVLLPNKYLLMPLNFSGSSFDLSYGKENKYEISVGFSYNKDFPKDYLSSDINTYTLISNTWEEVDGVGNWVENTTEINKI